MSLQEADKRGYSKGLSVKQKGEPLRLKAISNSEESIKHEVIWNHEDDVKNIVGLDSSEDSRHGALKSPSTKDKVREIIKAILNDKESQEKANKAQDKKIKSRGFQ